MVSENSSKKYYLVALLDNLCDDYYIQHPENRELQNSDVLTKEDHCHLKTEKNMMAQMVPILSAKKYMRNLIAYDYC